MKKTFLILSVALLAAFLLSGCMPGTLGMTTPQSTGPAATLGPKVLPSEIISQADAEAILDSKLVPNEGAESQTSLPSSGMKYVFYDAAVKGQHFLQVSIYERALFKAAQGQSAAFNPQSLFDAMKPTPTPSPKPTSTPTGSASAAVSAAPTDTPQPTPTPYTPGYEPVAGIGDEAFFAAPGLHFMYKGYYVVLSIGTTDSATEEGKANRELLKKLGEKVVENMKGILATATVNPADITPTPATTAPAASASAAPSAS